MRIDTILGNFRPQGADFNLNQSKIAIGSGGLWGKGYLNGTQTNQFCSRTKYRFFSAQSAKSSVFCELVILSLFTALIYRIYSYRNNIAILRSILRIRRRLNNFFHFIINIGMTIGLVPIIGIPLPFLSYGGSSLWGFTILLFIFIRLNNS